MLTLRHAIEALVFASPTPLTVPEIVKALRCAASESEDLAVQQLGEAGDDAVLAALGELKAEFARQERAVQLVEQTNGWTMATSKEAADVVRQLYPEARPVRLSGPALETLAIVAYRQPVTRADIEAVRGVAIDGVMQVLLDRGLVKIAGRAELPGRPLLYETTEYFLQHFGLKAVDELPNVDELRRVPLPKPEPPEVREPAAARVEPAIPTADADAAATAEPASAAEN
jgi:segregation and condensation protein B